MKSDPALQRPIVAAPQAQPTTTDHYQHSETIWRIALDVISLIILAVITVISHYVAIPFTRGFFCSDTTIKYPYRQNTIPTYAAVILSIALPIIVMWGTEFCKLFYFRWYQKEAFHIRLELCGSKTVKIAPFVRNLYMLTVVFIYGYLSTWVLLEIAKNFVGRLRPHFLAVCQPNFDCSTVTSMEIYNSYLLTDTNFTCTNPDYAAVREARRSFFSGHTAPLFYIWSSFFICFSRLFFLSYCFLSVGLDWLIMYIHVAWSWRHLGIVGHLLQTGLAILAFYVGYTRISDYHHHWQDVAVGAIAGSLIAFVTFKFILNWRHYDPRFLPYTAGAARAKAALAQQDGMPMNNSHRVASHHF